MSSTTIYAHQLWFVAPQQLEVRQQILPSLSANELLVQTKISAISAGTELLVYRGEIPAELSLDANFESQQQPISYPLQYGYASVGQVQHVGNHVNSEWLGKRVFSFQPHASYFIATPEILIPIPDDITDEQAIFLANMETAVNLVHDGNPGIGEKVVVFGQGVVGLLTTGILAQFPLSQLIAIDAIAHRRSVSLLWGATQAIDPFVEADILQLTNELTIGADLIYEISGVPNALNSAIQLSGFTSRIVIGSWYGTKAAPIALGGAAHRNRLTFITSQVSSLAPKLSGRWDKQRRFELAWQMIRELHPETLITTRVSITDANSLYKQLNEHQSDIIQAIFTYTNTEN